MTKQFAVNRAVRLMARALGIPPHPVLVLLAEYGFMSLDAIRAASDDELLAVPGIGSAKLATIREWTN